MTTILISALATLGLFFVLLAFVSKRKAPVQPNQQPVAPPTPVPPASASRPARGVSRPRVTSTPLPIGGLVLIGVVIVLIIAGICSGLSEAGKRIATAGPRWGEWKTLHLVSDGPPIRVGWKEGAVAGEHHIAPGPDKSRRFQMKSGNGKWCSVSEEDGMVLSPGEPCYFQAKKGDPPLDISFRWKFPN